MSWEQRERNTAVPGRSDFSNTRNGGALGVIKLMRKLNCCIDAVLAVSVRSRRCFRHDL